MVWGCVSQVGEQSWNVGRNAVLAAGWPESVPGTTLDRQCGSSASRRCTSPPPTVLSGQADLVVAGGVESMTRVPMGSRRRRRHAVRRPLRRATAASRLRRRPATAVQPGGRRRADRRAVGLLAQPARRVRAGQPRAGRRRAGRRRVRRRRSRRCRSPTAAVHRRRGHPPGHLAGEARRAEDPVPGRRRGHRRVGVADLRRGRRAAVTTSEWAARHGLRPLARVHTAVVAADDPVIMLTAPIPATAKALRRAGLAHRGHRCVRGERGVRAGAAGLAGRDRGRPGAAQPARRRDRARPPARRRPVPGS